MVHLDTSLLVKLYVPEPESADVARWIGEDSLVVVSEIARVEFASAVARLVREGTFSRARGRTLLGRLQADWERYARVGVDGRVLDEAIALLARHPLRTLDAVQLAGALVIDRRAPSRLQFGTADRRLVAAAAREGLPVLGAPAA